MQTIIVTDNPKGFTSLALYAPIVSTEDYLTSEHYHQHHSLRVINLCRSYAHQSMGYYISLLAKARDHKAIPSVDTIQDILNPSLTKHLSQLIHDEIQHYLHPIKSSEFTFSVYFGQNVAKKYAALAKKLHALFPLPLIRFQFEHKKHWQIKSVLPLSLADVPAHHLTFLFEAAEEYLSKKRFHALKKKAKFHDVAILIDPFEPNAPSNQKALEAFAEAGEALGMNVDFIEKTDEKSIAEYDALFIRATTSVNHYTYRFARRAAQENLVVIDDPQSIIKCSNKVYLAELLRTHQILTPPSRFLSPADVDLLDIDYPCILKKPDSAFSHGVIKIDSVKSMQKSLHQFFKTSELVVVQPFIPTEFDWRIGILDNKPIFACQYYMADGHWQIYNWDKEAVTKEGSHQAVEIEDVPEAIIKLALKATKLIGDGLYGVDIKSHGDLHYVIEINDNPNVDFGLEDQGLGCNVYENIMGVILQRIRRKHGYV